jgi:hypothetical protein
VIVGAVLLLIGYMLVTSGTECRSALECSTNAAAVVGIMIGSLAALPIVAFQLEGSYLYLALLNVVYLFAIGAFLGWLYGKTKNRNKNE